MSWLNTPVAIIEDDQSVPEVLYYIKIYIRTVRYLTTRYVGCDYAGACTWRDALLAATSPSTVVNAPTLEARLHSAGGGQYHVVATLKTISAWVEQKI